MRFISIFLVFVVFAFAKCEQVDINFKNMKIEDFLKMSSKILDKNILITKRINGEVNFISNKPICKDELENLLISVLETKGYTMVRDGGFLKVIRTSVASRANLPVVLNKPTGSLMVTKAIKVKNQNVDVVVQKVRHLISSAAKLVTLKQTNTLILTDYPKNIETVTKVISILAQKNSLEVKFVKLKFAKASVVSAHLNSIAKTLINQSVAPMKINIITDDTTNSIIMVANAKNIEKLQSIIDKLDIKEDFTSLKTEVITLKNSEAKNISKILSSAILKMSKRAKGKSSSITPAITSENELNVLIITATAKQLSQIKELVKKLDIPRQQVYVKAKIVEVSESKAESIGLKYGMQIGSISGDGLYALSTTLTKSVSPAITALQKDQGKSFAVDIALDFLAINGAAEVLSEPSILCVNNKESSIYVGETRSILVSSTTTATGAQASNYKRQDIGLTLSVKPRLSSDNKVSLSVKATMEGMKPGGGEATPTTTKKSVSTTAIVNDGEEVIVGGLISQDRSANRSKIPWLGDIPFLGGLFRGDNYNKSKTSLVIVLKPYIVKNSDDLTKLKLKLARLDRVRKRYTQIVLNSIKNHTKIDSTKLQKEEDIEKNLEIQEENEQSLKNQEESKNNQEDQEEEW